MKCVGPFYRQMPTTAASYQTWGWCWLYLDNQGHVIAVEWKAS